MLMLMLLLLLTGFKSEDEKYSANYSDGVAVRTS